MTHSSVPPRPKRVPRESPCHICRRPCRDKLLQCEDCRAEAMKKGLKRRHDSDDSLEEPASKQPKFSSYADFEPIILSDDEEEDADDNYNKVDRKKERKSLVVTLKVRYQPQSTAPLPEQHAASAINEEYQTLKTTVASVTAQSPHHPISNTIGTAEVNETKQEEPEAAPNQIEFAQSWMAALQITNDDTAQQVSALQAQMHRLIHADILQENQKLMLSGAVLAKDNKELRRKEKVRREVELRAARQDSEKLQTMGEELQTTKEKLQATEGKLQAAEDEIGRVMAQADREKTQLEQTIRERDEQLSKYRKYTEALAALQ